ncbi:MAG: hypothetical protein KR126chlam4_00397 [Candidatus Anoxychlamydiales bacterium]|uniref:Uncharacterized protein n=1 Tax=marine sediment metagenome TaxID=412755 RepID=A0A0F9CYT5_9ZZZZ|nr:hypothetical protein [Candidatus Anoxychlamydiales bacterium]NGX40575.1 hypothetical protein [Candidatus Anoxychlamydiales bacterium]HEU64197.1 hypothetical protein [Chlamydiota bacterium]
MTTLSTISGWATTAWNSFPNKSSIVNRTTDILNTTTGLVQNVTSYPMQDGLSNIQATFSPASFLTNLGKGASLLAEANPSYGWNMLDTQTTLMLTAVTLKAVSLFASCLKSTDKSKSNKLSLIANAGAYLAGSAMLLASYQYLQTSSCMKNSVPNNISSENNCTRDAIIQEAYRNCTK